MKSKKLIILLCVLFLMTACGKNEVDSPDKKENNTEQKSNNQNKSEEKEESEEVSFEVEGTNAPKDQGDLQVWFEGNIELEGNKVIAKGVTNLLPESRLTLDISPEEGTFIGGDGSGNVDSNGTFEIEAGVPDGFEGLLHVELSFKTGDQSDDKIKEHYSEGIKGGFARIYYDSYEDEMYSKAAFRNTIVFDGQSQSFSIIEPEWNKPDDLGNPTVWMKPTVEKFEDYVVVKIESNLIEDTFIRGTADIPNYITSGFSGSTYINPDGTATIYIKDPEKDSRIKGVSKYDIKIEVDPADGNNGKHVIEAYGENGERLSGDLVYKKDDGKAISQKVTISID
ncbi:hypothetical protein [Ornithinibacillus bavariensis]|uniref:Lipoprotein n=1 Tax=Ornithinibacillus bavariensis TaxID=545502 RepID=A0A919X905_9BACI|nr:hypothetical protein [Ornithinibacillus bavariensis]GIO27254.1 hypothetical protein J43TS3_18650 [Ornithinibacillus bavariensis]